MHPDGRGRGIGTALVRRIERMLGAGGARVLVVETSGLPAFARAFYRRLGYAEDVRIRNFYAAGWDKILFRALFP